MLLSRWLSIFVLITGLTIGLFVWQTLSDNQSRLIKKSVRFGSTTIKNKVTIQMEELVNALVRAAKRWEYHGGTEKEEWEHDLGWYIKHKQGFQAIEWVDRTYHVRWIVPLKGNESALNLDLSFESRRKMALDNARNQKKIIMTQSIDLVQGGKGVLVYIPLYVKNEFDGFLLGVFRLKEFLDTVLEEFSPDYSITLFEEQNEIYTNKIQTTDEQWKHGTEIVLYEVPWKIDVWPSQKLLNEKQLHLPEIVLLVMLLIVSLLTLVIFFFQKSRLRQLEVEKTNRKLEKHYRYLEKLIHDLELSNQELKEFAYIISHDLKTPIRGIGQLSGWLAHDYADLFDEKGTETLQLLIGRVKRLDRFIDGIRLYSEIGRTPKTEEPLNMNLLMRDILSSFTLPNHIRITQENDLPEIIADKQLMKQLFQNLLDNAVKFMDKQEGKIRIKCIEEESCWKFSIADNGPGIEEKYHEKVFQIFKTLTPRDKMENTGIGLTIVKKIITLSGGKIWIQSKNDEGSTFFFTLPKKQGANGEKQKTNSFG